MSAPLEAPGRPPFDVLYPADTPHDRRPIAGRYDLLEDAVAHCRRLPPSELEDYRVRFRPLEGGGMGGIVRFVECQASTFIEDATGEIVNIDGPFG